MILTAPHIVIDRLDITYRDDKGNDTSAVCGASLSLERGETLGIAGESGSGKSTLARALLGYTRPGGRFAAGSVTVGGTNVLSMDRVALRRFRGGRAAMVHQNPLSSLTPHLTIGNQLAEIVRRHTDLKGSEIVDRIFWLLERTGLPEPKVIASRYPHEISGGQRQRVVIAAALIGRSELLVLDEPTTALDKTVETEVLQLIKEIQSELNASMIYVSHDLNVISAMCSRVVIMKSCRIVEQGDVKELFSSPKTDYARDLIAAIPGLDEQGPEPKHDTGASPAPALSVDGLNFAYVQPSFFSWLRQPPPLAVKDLTVNIPEGQTLGVVGESGSGKSTLAALIAGVFSGNTGKIMIGEKQLQGSARTRPRDLRRRVQLVFQDPLSSLNPTHTIEDILTRPMRLYFGKSAPECHEAAVQLIKDLELSPELLKRFPRQLSGGEQQRIAIGRALAAEPDLLICDEVTSALDVTIQARVLDLLMRVQSDRRLTCLFISHDLGVIGRVSHTIAVLQDGELREVGPRNRILKTPEHAYTRRLLSSMPTVPS